MRGLSVSDIIVDGNKRISIAAMLLLLQMNGYKLQYSQPELIDLGLGLAAGNLDENDIQQWIKTHR